MEAKFSQRVKDVLNFSREEALRLNNDYIGLEHLILGVLREGEGLAIQILNYLGVDLSRYRKTIEQSIVATSGKSTQTS
jgi:ATP-dependent Clp protease ATP-binding subunit ClpC